MHSISHENIERMRDTFVPAARLHFAQAVSVAVDLFGIDLDTFIRSAMREPYAESLYEADPFLVASMSGKEMAMRILENTDVEYEDDERPLYEVGTTPNYWVGWMTIMLMYKLDIGIGDIFEHVSPDDFRNLYFPHHESSDYRFACFFCERYMPGISMDEGKWDGPANPIATGERS